MKDRERVKEKRRRHALEMVEAIGEKLPESLRRFREVDRALKEAKDDSAKPLCPHCGEKMRQKEQIGKRVICHGGDMVV